MLPSILRKGEKTLEKLRSESNFLPKCLLKNFYSVPYIYCGCKVDIRYMGKTIEVYHNLQRIAMHPKFPDYVTNRYETISSDLPDEFNQPETNDVRMRSWVATIGPNTLEVINRIFRSVQLEEQGYNAALSVLKLSKQYTNERFESACVSRWQIFHLLDINI